MDHTLLPGLYLRLCLRDACQQTPNHFRAVNKFLIKHLEFHVSLQSLVPVLSRRSKSYIFNLKS